MLTFCNLENQSVDGLVVAVGELVVQRLIAHIFAEHPGVGSKTRDSHADVVINLEYLFLVAGQFRWEFLEAAEDDMGVAAESKADGSLLDGFHGVLDLEEFALR